VRLGRTFSEIELIAIASRSLVTALNRFCRTRFSTKEAPFPKIPIFTFPFDGSELDNFKSLSPKVQMAIVSPIFITRNSVLEPRFSNSSPNASGVPVNAGNVPKCIGIATRGFTNSTARAARIGPIV
jgi:hypothetical protein